MRAIFALRGAFIILCGDGWHRFFLLFLFKENAVRGFFGVKQKTWRGGERIGGVGDIPRGGDLRRTRAVSLGVKNPQHHV